MRVGGECVWRDSGMGKGEWVGMDAVGTDLWSFRECGEA